MKKKTNKNELGSSTLEFIFCAPLLLIVMYAAMEINERIEQRVNTAIATGNAVWLAKPETTFQRNSATEELLKADILGTKNAGTQNIGTNGAAFQNGQSVLAYSDEKLKASSYSANMSRDVSLGSEDSAYRRASQKIGDTKIDPFANTLGVFASNMIRIYRRLVDPPEPSIPSMFPDTQIEHTQVAWSISNSGTANLAMKAIEDLSKQVGVGTNSQLPKIDSDEYRMLAQQIRYLRRNAGYHNNDYKNEALLGFAFGIGDTDNYDNFVNKCFMKLDKNMRSDCGEDNGFYDYLEMRHNTVAMGKTFMSCVCTGLDCPVKIAFKLVLETAKQFVIGAIQSKVESVISDQVTHATDAIATEIASKLKDPKDLIEGKVKNVQATIENQVNQSLDEVLK